MRRSQQSTNSGGYQLSQNFRGHPRSGRGRGRETPSATSTSAAAGASASQSGQQGGRRRYVCFLLPNLNFRYGFRSKYYNKSGSRPSQRSRYTGGKTASFPLKLGKTVSGPIHSVNSQRMTIDWLQVPSQLREIPCPKFSKSQSNQISAEMNKLVEKNAIEVTKPSPNQFVSHIFLASKKDRTNRPVINLKQLTRFL